MVYTINDDCNQCGNCSLVCPNGAIQVADNQEGYWIDPTLCDGCASEPAPLCHQVCDPSSLIPLPAKKGRYKSTKIPTTVLDLFVNRKTTPFASSMVIWETCNILAQRHTLPWQTDAEGFLTYHRPVQRGKGEMRFRLTCNLPGADIIPEAAEKAKTAIANYDIRSTCIHLIFAAYAVASDRPWQESFSLNNQQIEQYLGLHKRKDLTKLDKLAMIKKWVHEACSILVTINWPRQGKVQAFSLEEHPVWSLLDTQYYFEEDEHGYRHLVGLEFTLKAGIWVKYFLNKEEYRRQNAFYQYSTLPQSLLAEIMSNWQQHEGEIRLLLWLLFKARLGGDQRLKVRTLLNIAYGEERVLDAITVRSNHKRLLKMFESDLESIYFYGLKPLFDEETYPHEIQPLWARMAAIPDDTDAAVEFWAEDANTAYGLTDNAPRDKWQRLLNGRLLGFELPQEWQQTIQRRTAKRSRPSSQDKTSHQPHSLSGKQVTIARQQKNLTQRALAIRLGKSQSWIRDIEKERFRINADDQILVEKVLDIK